MRSLAVTVTRSPIGTPAWSRSRSGFRIIQTMRTSPDLATVTARLRIMTIRFEQCVGNPDLATVAVVRLRIIIIRLMS